MNERKHPFDELEGLLREQATVTGEGMLLFFTVEMLPEKFQRVAAVFGRAAVESVQALPRSAERTVALRKLLEAKDAAIRAAM
jgi:hypothetical protein